MSKTTPLYDLHKALGAKFTDFAGYDMPVQYPGGVLQEHQACRERAALFDVSHMGQVDVTGSDADAALERVTTADLQGLPAGRQRYSLLLNEDGGIVDDLMIARPPSAAPALRLVINAARKEADMAVFGEGGVPVTLRDDLALLALQGPEARSVLTNLVPTARDLAFMDVAEAEWQDAPLFITCSGYTGEDGYEISVPVERADAFARALLDFEMVSPAGLAARDVLRLEAGLCLYGQDMDESTSPGVAGVGFAVSKRRREVGDMRGHDRILGELSGTEKKARIALALEGRAAARTGADIVKDGQTVGHVTSGAYSPSLGHAIALGFAPKVLTEPGTEVSVHLRGKPVPATAVSLPFRPSNYVRRSDLAA